MAYNQKDVDWVSKEKREFASKTTNSLLMKEEKPTKKRVGEILDISKQVVDFIFTAYPDQVIIPEASQVAPTDFKVRDDFKVPDAQPSNTTKTIAPGFTTK